MAIPIAVPVAIGLHEHAKLSPVRVLQFWSTRARRSRMFLQSYSNRVRSRPYLYPLVPHRVASDPL